MGTRLTIVIETELSIDELRMAVSLLDALDAGEEAIAPENVSAWDVIQYVVTGDLGLVPLTSKVQYDEGDPMPDLRQVINEAGGDLHRALDGVVVNKMEPTS